MTFTPWPQHNYIHLTLFMNANQVNLTQHCVYSAYFTRFSCHSMSFSQPPALCGNCRARCHAGIAGMDVWVVMEFECSGDASDLSAAKRDEIIWMAQLFLWMVSSSTPEQALMKLIHLGNKTSISQLQLFVVVKDLTPSLLHKRGYCRFWKALPPELVCGKPFFIMPLNPHHALR